MVCLQVQHFPHIAQWFLYGAPACVGGVLFTHGPIVLLVPLEAGDGHAEEWGWVGDVQVAQICILWPVR